MNKHLATTKKNISKILSRITGAGEFKKIVELASGEKVTYRFSWAVGMHFSHISRKYKNYFRVALPAWTNFQHPYHVVQLCALAIETKLPLPNCYSPSRKRIKTV